MPGRAPELRDLVRDAEAQKKTGARARHTETGRDPERSAVRKRPSHGRSHILRGPVNTEVVVRSETAVDLDARLEVFRTKIAALGPGSKRERPADAYRIAELKRFMPNVLLCDEILRDRPAFDVTAQDQLGFDLPFLLRAALVAWLREIVFAVVIHHLQQSLVCAVDVFKLDVEHRIDPVLVRQHTKAVLPAIARKDGGFAARTLGVQVKLGGPPGPYAVFELRRVAQKAVTVDRTAENVLGGELQVSRFLHLMRIGDEEGTSARRGTQWKQRTSRDHHRELVCNRLADQVLE